MSTFHRFTRFLSIALFFSLNTLCNSQGVTADQAWSIVNTEYAKLDSETDCEKILPLQEFIQLEQSECFPVLNFIADKVVGLKKRFLKLNKSFAEISQLHASIMHLNLSTNHHIWRYSHHINTALGMVSTHFQSLSAMTMANIECMPLPARLISMRAIAMFGKLQEKILEGTWHSFAFGIYREVAEGSIDDEGEVVRPELVQSHLKDQLWLQLITGKLQAFVEAYHNEMLVALQEAANTVVATKVQRKAVHERKYHERNFGMFSSLEALKRTQFDGWILDKGLLREVMRSIILPTRDSFLGPSSTSRPDRLVTVGDFGAGGGHYSQWLNNTGLVRAFAYDGTNDIHSITSGQVSYMNLAEDADLGTKFDWVLSIEVAEHIPETHSVTMIQNWARHARVGIIMSWSEVLLGIGHVNPMPFAKAAELVSNVTGMDFDPELTEKLRGASEVSYIKQTVGVFRWAECEM